MKMWTSPKLYQACGDWRDSRDWWFCNDWLQRHFDIPRNTKHIWVTVGVDPSPNRVAVEFKIHELHGAITGRIVGGHVWLNMYRNFRLAIIEHFGPRLTSGPLYLGLLYED